MNKHNYECNYVKKRCDKRPSIDTFVNIEYRHNLIKNTVKGEVDVWEIYPTYEVYYEVKSKHHPKQYEKALHQTLRWTKYMKKKEPDKNYYGVYRTHNKPQYTKILCKNGEVR